MRAALLEMEDRLRREATLQMMERSMKDIDAGRTKAAEKALRDAAAKLGLRLARESVTSR